MKAIWSICIGLLLSCSLSAQIDQGRILDAINELRADGCTCGTEDIKPVNSLRWDKNLATIAKSYADHLYDNQIPNAANHLFLSHVGTDGSTLEQRLQEAGYAIKSACENIAYVSGNENMAIDYWLNNPGTCKNLMDKKSTVAGVARSHDFWVLILAQPAIKKANSVDDKTANDNQE